MRVSAMEMMTYWITCQPMLGVCPASIQRWIIAAKRKAGAAMNIPATMRRSSVGLRPNRSALGYTT